MTPLSAAIQRASTPVWKMGLRELTSLRGAGGACEPGVHEHRLANSKHQPVFMDSGSAPSGHPGMTLKIWLRGRPGSQHRQHVSDQRVADDIPVTEPHHGDVRYRVEPPGDFGETGEAVEQIALVGVARYHHRRVPAQPGQQHLDLAIGAVLRLVDY